MGASQSKSLTNVNVTSEAITNVISNNVSNCSANTNSSQLLSVSDITATGCQVNFSDISQNINVQQLLTCSQNQSNQTNLATQFATQLDQVVSSKISGLNLVSNIEIPKLLKNELFLVKSLE